MTVYRLDDHRHGTCQVCWWRGNRWPNGLCPVCGNDPGEKPQQSLFKDVCIALFCALPMRLRGLNTRGLV